MLFQLCFLPEKSHSRCRKETKDTLIKQQQWAIESYDDFVAIRGVLDGRCLVGTIYGSSEEELFAHDVAVCAGDIRSSHVAKKENSWEMETESNGTVCFKHKQLGLYFGRPAARLC